MGIDVENRFSFRDSYCVDEASRLSLTDVYIDAKFTTDRTFFCYVYPAKAQSTLFSDIKNTESALRSAA